MDKSIKGYFSANEINSMNELKDFEERLRDVLLQIEDQPVEPEDASAKARWLSIARTHLEIGFMFALKAIARPSNGISRK